MAPFRYDDKQVVITGASTGMGAETTSMLLDAGAKVSSGALRNNYLPEPTMFFFWKSWKEGQTFETAVTSAYRKTINLMNDAVSAFVGALPGGQPRPTRA